MESPDEREQKKGEYHWGMVVFAAVLVMCPWPILALAVKRDVSPDILAIPADGTTLDAPVSPIFARSPYFVIYDVSKNENRYIRNPYVNDAHAAGLRIAHLLIDERVGVVITKNIGPEPFRNLHVRDVKVFVGTPTTVADAIRQYQRQRLVPASTPTVPIHHGLTEQGRQAPRASEPCPFSGQSSAPAPYQREPTVRTPGASTFGGTNIPSTANGPVQYY